MFKIAVHFGDDERFEISANNWDTIRMIKEKIVESKEGLPGVEQQMLFFASEQMQQNEQCNWCYAKMRFEVPLGKTKTFEWRARTRGGSGQTASPGTGRGVLRAVSIVFNEYRSPSQRGVSTHTSTASVAVLPEPDKPEVIFLPDDLKEEYMRSSGPGGVNVNANSTCRKVMYERYLAQNKKIALQRLAAILLKQKVNEATRRHESHRKLRMTVHGVGQFLDGGQMLEQMVDALIEMYEHESVEQQQKNEEEETGKKV
ncbi:hypothetical protein niasHT_024354 [Heterodera trifolii]|uniref:Prokaryotic-type class I peptide chain release factors domain-containing protein n=1 Tax=Heterodera trifolii TaxID=157864 RepID=A0ABD2JYQ7_9BILA